MTFPSPSSLLRLRLSVRKTFPDISSCTPVCARVRKRKERCKDDAFGVDAGGSRAGHARLGGDGAELEKGKGGGVRVSSLFMHTCTLRSIVSYLSSLRLCYSLCLSFGYHRNTAFSFHPPLKVLACHWCKQR